MLGHVGDQAVEHTALPKQRVGAGFARVGLQQLVHAEAFADGAEQREQRGDEGSERFGGSQGYLQSADSVLEDLRRFAGESAVA